MCFTLVRNAIGKQTSVVSNYYTFYAGTPELGGGAGGAGALDALYQEGQGGQKCPFNLKDCLGEIANCQKC